MRLDGRAQPSPERESKLWMAWEPQAQMTPSWTFRAFRNVIFLSFASAVPCAVEGGGEDIPIIQRKIVDGHLAGGVASSD